MLQTENDLTGSISCWGELDGMGLLFFGYNTVFDTE